VEYVSQVQVLQQDQVDQIGGQVGQAGGAMPKVGFNDHICFT